MNDWREWHGRFVNLINGDVASRTQRLWTLVAASAVTSKIAKQTSNDFCSLNWTVGSEVLTEHQVAIRKYNGSCDTVQRIAKLLADEPGLVALIAHGSIGSSDEVSYSDFDGLVIIKDETIRSPSNLAKLASKLTLARQEMYRYDPLQHHGWFALPESALDCWPEDYLPVVSLDSASAFGTDDDLSLTIKSFCQVSLLVQHFRSVSFAVRRELDTGSWRKSVYQTKSMLSKLMLLPCLYLQAKAGKGCDKKSSFVDAKGDFREADWKAIETASGIRASWPRPKFGFPQRLFATQCGLLGDLTRKRFAPKTPEVVLGKLDESFRNQAISLIEAMEERLVFEETLQETS